MRTILARIPLIFIAFLFVGCLRYPVDFSDPSVLRGNFVGTITSICQVTVYQTSWSPDSKKIATLDNRADGRLTVWDSKTGTEMSFIDHVGFEYGANKLVWTSDGKRIKFLSSQDFQFPIQTYNTETKLLEAPIALENPDKYVISQISRDARRITGYLSEWDQSTNSLLGLNIRVWDALTGQVLNSKQFRLSKYSVVASSTKGDEIAIWVDGVLQIWSVISGLKTHEWNFTADSIQSLTYSNNDQSLNALVGSNYSGTSQFVRFDKSSKEVTKQTRVNAVRVFAFSDDGKLVSLLDYTNNQIGLRLLNLETGAFSTIPTGFGVGDAGVFSSDGQSLVYSNYQTCSLKHYSFGTSDTSEIALQVLVSQPITVQINASWQDERYYLIAGTASLNNQTGFTVQGTGYAADDEYFVNPRTPALRPRVVVGSVEFWNFIKQESNVFRGAYRSVADKNSFLNLTLNRQP
jgi:Tol biopolymer transport system component